MLEFLPRIYHPVTRPLGCWTPEAYVRRFVISISNRAASLGLSAGMNGVVQAASD